MKDIIDPESHKSQPDLSQDDIEHIRACLCDHFVSNLLCIKKKKKSYF